MNTEERIRDNQKKLGAERSIAVCRRVGSCLPPDPELGVETRKCSECNYDIYVSESTQKMGSAVDLVCDNCHQLVTIGDKQIITYSREAIADWKRMHGTDPTPENIAEHIRNRIAKSGITNFEISEEPL